MATAYRRDAKVSPQWWGVSPALDLQMYCHSNTVQPDNSSNDTHELNFLLIGGGDGRHLLKTIGQARRWPRRKLNFYIIESDLELLARQMLFLTLVLENPEKMGLQEKTETFVELFGNSLIRSQTATYLQEKCDLFIRYVTDPDFQQTVMPSLNLNALKYKERDELENMFKFWRTTDPKLFPIENFWDLSNRQYLGRRYDSRNGAYDWDLTMKLQDRGAGVIHSREYCNWRENGVAFMNREGNYDVPNKTLASQVTVVQNGTKVHTRGYWGDITTSPYIAFGIESEDKSLFKKANGVHVKTAQDISLYNITALFYELITGQKYSLPSTSTKSEETKLSKLSPEQSDSKRKITESNNREITPENQSQPTRKNDFLPLNDVEIHFLPLSWVNELHHKSKFLKLFNLIYFSCRTVHFLKPQFKQISAYKATLVLELTKFVLDLQAEKVKNCVSLVTDLAKESGFAARESIYWKSNHVASFELIDDFGTTQNGL
ncbi:dynein axonemal assembly factor 3 [Bombina bombina]|uniref:dynein axonemal assembly factor 3 n=1 Tax=Bombina bombina TaxID=8345 RepID=UPI00235A65FC|nr:dynein axonemal assembly factor 3 [Bombina bombina]